jgi:hypothetical protein
MHEMNDKDHHNQDDVTHLMNRDSIEASSNKRPPSYSHDCIHDLLKRQQFIFAQLLRKANQQEVEFKAHRRSSVSGYKMFRLEHRFGGLKEWNALPLATRARYHELAAERIRAYKEHLSR